MRVNFVIRFKKNPHEGEGLARDEIRRRILEDWHQDPLLTLEIWADKYDFDVDIEFDECDVCEDRKWIFTRDKDGEKCLIPCPDCVE